jgi:hypothetical protein
LKSSSGTSRSVSDSGKKAADGSGAFWAFDRIGTAACLLVGENFEPTVQDYSRQAMCDVQVWVCPLCLISYKALPFFSAQKVRMYKTDFVEPDIARCPCPGEKASKGSRAFWAFDRVEHQETKGNPDDDQNDAVHFLLPSLPANAAGNFCPEA